MFTMKLVQSISLYYLQYLLVVLLAGSQLLLLSTVQPVAAFSGDTDQEGSGFPDDDDVTTSAPSPSQTIETTILPITSESETEGATRAPLTRSMMTTTEAGRERITTESFTHSPTLSTASVESIATRPIPRTASSTHLRTVETTITSESETEGATRAPLTRLMMTTTEARRERITTEPEATTSSRFVTMETSTQESSTHSGATEIESTTPFVTTEAITKNPPFVIDEECRVPAYASINYETMFSAPVANDSLLVVEGQCYLACMESLSKPEVGYGRFRERQTNYPPWPYYTLKELNCNPHKFIHECTRGCVIARNDIATCDSLCHSDCSLECGSLFQCNNPDSDEWWVRKTCSLTCSHSRCSIGCHVVDTGAHCRDSDCRPPLTPVASPTLTPVVNSKRAGMYVVDLIHTVSPSDLLSHNVAFLFEIHDNATGNFSYHWLVDPQTLDLADFSCREVTVRFAVANLNGLSGFSESIRIPQVYGDPTRRPNPVTSIRIRQEDDTRVGYFGHVIWTVTWDPPQSQLHLEGYTVEVYNSNPNEPHCGQRVWTQMVDLNETTSVTVISDQPGNLLVMSCPYTVEVHALGLDENESVALDFYADIFPSRPQFIRDLQCNRLWDPMEYKFFFNFTWSLPFYMAVEDPIEVYYISVELIRGGSNVPIDSVRTNSRYVPPNLQPNETSFNYYVPHEGQSFFLPQADHNLKFRFKLFFRFNATNIRFPSESSALPTRQFTCTMDTGSPAPSVVQNLSIVSFELLSTTKIFIKFSWVPPTNPNGILRNYYVCLSQKTLGKFEEPLPHSAISVCDTVNGTLTETSVEMNFFLENLNCLYFQIRANNDFVSGEWTDASVIRADESKPCALASSESLSPSVPPQDPALLIGVPVIVSVIVALFGGILAVCVCVCCLRRRKQKWRYQQTSSGIDFLYSSGPRHHLLTQTSTDPQLPEIDEWEISPSEVIIEDSLGEGAFGEVYKGVVKGPLKCSKLRPSLRNAIAIPVAIKLLKDSARGSERQDFLSEIDMMKMISEGHNPNVIGLVGCVTLQEPLSLILEFVTYGDLLSYLRMNMRMNAGQEEESSDNPYLQLGTVEPVDLVKFSYQIASGMEYLSSLGIVHRDLACRNILVDEGKILKITDFGMSREVDEIYIQKSKGRVPLKWMALESILTRQFTTASDVWSYGITLWEIGTMGGFPYPSISNEELIPLLKNGYRMEKPDNCSPEIYDIMLCCWDGNPNKRPTFTELRLKFDRMLQSNAEYIYFLPINSDKACYNPENAPEGMKISVTPVHAFLSPNVARKRISLCSFRDTCVNEATPSHQSIKSGNLSGRSSGHSSPGRRSPRSVSPSVDPFVQGASNAVNRSASLHLTQDASRNVHTKRTANLYVKDPSQLGGNTAQVRPASMLISRPSESISSSSQNGLDGQDKEARRRPSSVITPHNESSNGGVPGYVNVPQNGGVNESVGVAVINPLFEHHTDERRRVRGQESEIPDIQIVSCL